MASVATMNVTSVLKNASAVLGWQKPELLNAEETAHILEILMFYVTPAVSTLGVLGNIFSIIILLKHGLDKCSNILLFCLAVTDLIFLVSFNSVPKILYEIVGVPHGWAYDRTRAFAAFVGYQILNTLDYAMGYTSLTLPMFITVERLVAVFLPFRFNDIVTSFRTWTTVFIVYIFWFTYLTYSAFWLEFEYTYHPKYNVSVGMMTRSSLYYQNFHSIGLIEEVYLYFCVKIPPCFTLIGCILISVRIKMASVARKKLTSSTSAKDSASSNRTTKMLLAVCAVYTATCAVVVLPNYVPEYAYFTLTNDAPSNVGRIMYQVLNISLCVNSSCNFVIYVGMNKNFRDTYKSLFTPCLRASCCQK